MQVCPKRSIYQFDSRLGQPPRPISERPNALSRTPNQAASVFATPGTVGWFWQTFWIKRFCCKQAFDCLKHLQTRQQYALIHQCTSAQNRLSHLNQAALVKGPSGGKSRPKQRQLKRASKVTSNCSVQTASGPNHSIWRLYMLVLTLQRNQ